MKNKKRNNGTEGVDLAALDRRRARLEGCASVGLLLVCVALAIPFFNLTEISSMVWCRWIYAAGALIYLIARAFVGTDPRESLRVRRLRRVEFWAGVAFCIGAGMWFYNFNRLGEIIITGGTLGIIRDTVMFTLVGAALQLMASWMIYFRKKRDMQSRVNE